MDSNQTKFSTPDTNASKMKDKNQHIQVFVRVRPMNSQEKAKNSITVLDCPGGKEVVVKERTSSNVTKTFTFDKVFGPNSKQIEVYKSVVAPLLEEVLLGYNCTVFAYGQTGTGKTFTMEGDRQYDSTLGWDKDPMSGIVPRALNQLFDELRMQKAEFTVRVSLLELYNEELFDLLASTEDMKLKNLRLYEDNTRKGSVVIQGLEEVTVHDKHEVYTIMERGAQRRQTAATLMNEKSSRSHSVFTVTVHIKESNMEGEELLKIGKLHLVDLAGSENIGRSGAVDKRAREAGSINQSLLTLGRVITALVERTPHVPYRESKLTRILQDSLGGRTKTSIIATVSPSSLNIEETLSTLDYAHRAKNITNRPEINQKLTKKAILKAYTEEIEQLKKDLLATREKNGIFIDKGNYERMVNQIEAQGQDISERITFIKSLEDNIEKKEEELESTKATLLEKEEDLQLANQVIEDLKYDLKTTQNELKLTRLQRDEKEHLVSKHVETETKLSSEAGKLLETANSTTVSLEKLYSKLERKRRVEESNLETGKRFRGDITEQLMSSIENFITFRSQHAKLSGEQRLDLDLFLQTKTSHFEKLKAALADLSEEGAFRLSNTAKLFKKHVFDVDQWAESANNEVDKNKQSFVTFYNNLINDFGGRHEVLSNIVAEMFQSHEKFFNQTLQFVNASELDFQLVLNSCAHLIDTVWSSVDEFVKIQNNDMAVVRSELNTLKTAGGCYDDDFEKQISLIKNSLKALEDSKKNVLNEFAEKNKILTSKVESRNEEVTHFSTKLSSILSMEKAKNDAAKTDTGKPFDSFKSEATYDNNIFIKNTFDAQTNVTQQRDAAKSSFKAAQELYSDFAEALKRQNRLICDDSSSINLIVEKDSADVASIIHLKTVELEQEAKESFDTDSKMAEKLKEDIESECNWITSWSDDQSNQITQQLGMVSEYFDSTYLIDLPTGATPLRKVYEYPSTLSTTSPHDSLLGRFRRARNVSISSTHNISSRLSCSDIEEESAGSTDNSDSVQSRESNNDVFVASEGAVKEKNKEDSGLDAVNKGTSKPSVSEDKTPPISKVLDKENSAISVKVGKPRVNSSRQGASKEQMGKSKDVLKAHAQNAPK